MKTYSADHYEMGGVPVFVDFVTEVPPLVMQPGETKTIRLLPNHYRLRHFVRHSPDGFGWGYGGSGPCELARCILLDHFGYEEGDEIFERHYTDFCQEVIAHQPQKEPFRLTTLDIEEWLWKQKWYREHLVDSTMKRVRERLGVDG